MRNAIASLLVRFRALSPVRRGFIVVLAIFAGLFVFARQPTPDQSPQSSGRRSRHRNFHARTTNRSWPRNRRIESVRQTHGRTGAHGFRRPFQWQGGYDAAA